MSLGLPSVALATRARPEVHHMVPRPDALGAFQFVAISRLRAHQLTAGSVPRFEGPHTVAVMAQMEVAAGKIQVIANAQLGADS